MPPLHPLRPGGRGVIINGTPSDWAGRYEVVVLAMLIALPAAVLAVWLLVRWRRRTGCSTRRAWHTSIAEVGIVYGTAPWLWLTMLPGSGARSGHHPVSLVPLRDLQTMPAFEIAGNLLVFASLGLLAPVRLAALARTRRVIALAAACSILVETAQYVLPLDRVASVDDVLLNTAGAALAALVSRPWWARREQPHSGVGRTGWSVG